MLTAVKICDNQITARFDYDEQTDEAASEKLLKELDRLSFEIDKDQILVMYQNGKPIKFLVGADESWTFVRHSRYDTFVNRKTSAMTRLLTTE